MLTPLVTILNLSQFNYFTEEQRLSLKIHLAVCRSFFLLSPFLYVFQHSWKLLSSTSIICSLQDKSGFIFGLAVKLILFLEDIRIVRDKLKSSKQTLHLVCSTTKQSCFFEQTEVLNNDDQNCFYWQKVKTYLLSTFLVMLLLSSWWQILKFLSLFLCL